MVIVPRAKQAIGQSAHWARTIEQKCWIYSKLDPIFSMNTAYFDLERSGTYRPGGSLSHISATHPCAHTSKSAPKWRNLHHQILHP